MKRLAPRVRRLALTSVAALATLGSAASVEAGPWTRDPGHFYVNLSYQYMSTRRIYGADFSAQDLGATYTQHQANFYGEVGMIQRWLTATIEATAFRHNELVGQGYTQGMGDMRFGFWTGLVERPFRLTAAFLAGLPSGDPKPSAGPLADPEATLIANSLPTGDGETDFEGRLSFGYSFGKARRWPLEHYVVAEAGYWLRTKGFFDAFTYKAELGTKLPFRFVERFWLIFRFFGQESFVTAQESPASFSGSGLGNGVTLNAYGVELAGRIAAGLGFNIGVDGAFRARLVPATPNLKVGLSYQF